MKPDAAQIVAHHPQDPSTSGHVRLPGWESWSAPKALVEHDPDWVFGFARLAEIVSTALGDRVLDLHHVGSTAVAGLPAKPVIDIDLVVADPAQEDAYAPALQAAGFHFHAREPGWHHHRLFKWREPFSHLHVFGPDCPEVIRHLMFRDWLAAHPDDRELYAAAKRRALAVRTPTMPYTRAKAPTVLAIYDRMFRAHGLQ